MGKGHLAIGTTGGLPASANKKGKAGSPNMGDIERTRRGPKPR